MQTNIKEAIEFQAEIKKVVSKKTASLDKEIGIVLNTNDLGALQLAMIDTDQMIRVSITLEE